MEGERTMRRHALLLSIIVLGAVSALATPVRAQAVTGVRSFPQEFVTPICNGDVLHLSGTLLNVETATALHSGGFLFREQFQLQGTATDLTTGTVFHGTTYFRDLEITTPAGGGVVTFTNGTRLVSGGESVNFNYLAHFTVTPDGTTTVFFESVTAC
jgi:hypothetical protein